jgi:hypothetical protein
VKHQYNTKPIEKIKEMNEHILHLECDIEYMNNRLGDFVVKLPEKLPLKGNWSVGVDEISFPIDFNVVVEYRRANVKPYPNLSERKHNIKHHHDLMKQNEDHHYLNHRTKMFEEISLVIADMENIELNAELKDFIAFVEVTMKELSENSIELNKDNTMDAILEVLNTFDVIKQSFASEYHTVTDRHNLVKITDKKAFFNNIKIEKPNIINMISIHTDIVDTPHENKIKSCHIKGLYKEQYSETWPTTQYFPVNKSEVEYIRITLKTTEKSILLLNNGPVCLTLHFKKK